MVPSDVSVTNIEGNSVLCCTNEDFNITKTDEMQDDVPELVPSDVSVTNIEGNSVL